MDMATHLFSGARWRYFAWAAGRRLSGSATACPSCGAAQLRIIRRKLLVTALVRCEKCRLLYRIPTDQPHASAAFYEEEYTSGFTTDCPSREELSRMLTEKFVGTPKDFSGRIRFLEALGVSPGARMLDFGASWGYGTWQLREAGFDVEGYEIGASRARYARECVGVQVHDQAEAIRGRFDVFFSCHVLEHLPDPTVAFRMAQEYLRPQGLFVAFTPNGSSAYRNRDERRYHKHWGHVHPVYLDDEFYATAFAEAPKLLSSSPYDPEAIGRWNRTSDLTMDLSGWELAFAAVL